MSDTPRTDAESTRVYNDEKRYEDSYDVAVAAWEFARQLERELNLSNELRVELLAKINKLNNDPR